MTRVIWHAGFENRVTGLRNAAKLLLVAASLVAAVTSLSVGSSLAESPRKSPETDSAVPAEPTVGDLYALVVGVSKYKNPKVPRLEVSDRDAKAFADFLNTQDKLFSKVHLTLLLNEGATAVEVKKHLFHKLRRAGKNDTVVLFFSGHGSTPPDIPGEYFLLTHDADPQFLEATAVNMTRMRFLERLDSKRVVVIADTCHAGGFKVAGSKSVQPALSKFLQQFKESAGRVVITSCRPDEISLEKPALGNSIFTHYLIRGLKNEADFNRDGIVTLEEAYDFAYARTKDETNGVQHPQWEGRVEGAMPLSFLHPGKPSLSLVIRPVSVDVYLRDQTGSRHVGKTNEYGRLVLRDLPLDKPLFVQLKKVGWQDLILGPHTLSKDELHKRLPPVELKPRVAFLALRASLPGVNVRIGEREAGVTSEDGLLMIEKAQVGVTLKVNLRKDGFEEKTIDLVIPVSHENKVYMSSLINLDKAGRMPARSEVGPASREQKPVSRATAGRKQDAKPMMNYSRVVRNLIQRAKEGDAEAQFKLGLRFLRGEGVPRNHEEAAKWFKLAVQAGGKVAQEKPGKPGKAEAVSEPNAAEAEKSKPREAATRKEATRSGDVEFQGPIVPRDAFARERCLEECEIDKDRFYGRCLRDCAAQYPE